MTQPDMSQILAQAQQMQAQLQAAQQEILASSVVGDAANGLVTVTMSGSGEVTAVTIDPKVVDPDDVETLQDMILVAVNDVLNQITEESGKLMGGMGMGF